MAPLLPLLLLLPLVRAGLLGAGEGEGSCAAPPFRARYVKWSGGCPGFAPCCTEYGYCRPLVSEDTNVHRIPLFVWSSPFFSRAS